MRSHSSADASKGQARPSPARFHSPSFASAFDAPDSADARRCCPALSFPPAVLSLARSFSIVYLFGIHRSVGVSAFARSQSMSSRQAVRRRARAHHRKYRPQLAELPSMFTPIPLYRPARPSLRTMSLKALRIPKRLFPVATWNLTLRRSRGCMQKVDAIPAPMPQMAWSCAQARARRATRWNAGVPRTSVRIQAQQDGHAQWTTSRSRTGAREGQRRAFHHPRRPLHLNLILMVCCSWRIGCHCSWRAWRALVAAGREIEQKSKRAMTQRRADDAAAASIL